MPEERAPDGVYGGVADGGGSDAAVLPPGSPIEDTGESGEDYVLPVEDAASLVEVGEAEERGGEKERPARADASFEEVLNPASEEDFFWQGDGKE